MPIHDWTKVRAGLFHDFHQVWTIALRKLLNQGVLPKGYTALAEQVTEDSVPDLIALERWPRANGSPASGGLMVADAPPRARVQCSVQTDPYAARANRITIRDPAGEVVAIIEIVSPGNKDREAAVDAFCSKIRRLMSRGIHVLFVDLFPPGTNDPLGLHNILWHYFSGEPTPLPEDKPLMVAAYESGPRTTAYLEPLAVGDTLPDMPIFLDTGRYVLAPLEAAYQAAWDDTPEEVRELVD